MGAIRRQYNVLSIMRPWKIEGGQTTIILLGEIAVAGGLLLVLLRFF